MEVLFISHKYPPGIGGMQKQSYELINGFVKTHRVHMIVHDESKESKFTFFLRIKSRVKKAFKNFPGIQLVHCNDGVCAVNCRFIQGRYNVPVLLTFHGLDLLWPNRIYQTLLPSMSKDFTAVICVSDFTREECIKRGFLPGDAYTVKNGVDVDEEADPLKVNSELIGLYNELKLRDKKIMVSVGRPVKRKGFSWFVRHVLNRLDDNYAYIVLGPSTHFSFIEKSIIKVLPSPFKNQLELFFGWTSDQEELLREIQLVENKKRAHWFDKLNYDSILFALEQSDVFVMPNIKVRGDAEGFGLVALESNIQKTFTLASDIDGIPSAISYQENGWLVESENPESWLKAIKLFFSLPINDRQELENKAYQFVKKNCTWDSMVDGYIEVFNRYIDS